MNTWEYVLKWNTVQTAARSRTQSWTPASSSPPDTREPFVYHYLNNLIITVLRIRIRIRSRIRRIHVFLGLLDPDPDPLVSGMDPDPDPSIYKISTVL
jgi:hypothetical protein